MGNPPKEALVRKLLAKYLRFSAETRNFQTVKRYYSELQSCWEKFGMNSRECDSVVAKIDVSQSNDQTEFNDYKTFDFSKSFS